MNELDGGADAEQLPDGSGVEASVDVDADGLDGSFDGGPDDGSFAGDADEPEVECGALAPSECVVQIAAGYDFACALFFDGHVRCWGSNGCGQIATGEIVDGGGFDMVTPESVFPPMAIPDLHDVRQIALQGSAACALDKDGRVFCWGQNDQANAGQPPTTPFVLTPTQVQGLGPAKKLLPNIGAMCAELHDGQVWCWGDNTFARFAGPDGGAIVPPVRVPALEGATVVGTGGNAYYAVQADGGILSFGANNLGMLGRGVGPDELRYDPNPGPVVGLPERAVGIGQGSGAFQCAILQSRAIACWGDNRSEQIAPGASRVLLTPTVVSGVGGVVEVVEGYDHTCARLSDGGLSCWGKNNAAVGRPSAPGSSPPTHVEGLGPLVQVVASGIPFTCALERTGVVKCWGNPLYQVTGRLPDAGEDVFHVPNPITF